METHNFSEKQIWKPGNMLYPLPAVLVTCRNAGIDNVFTVAWTGTICTNPAMVYISVRPERYSYDLIKESKSFVINLTTEELVKATDYCGVTSGRDTNKFKDCNLETIEATKIDCPMLKDSPVNIECELVKIEELGSHHMFIANVLAVHAANDLMDDKGRFQLENARLLTYSHGEYFGLGDKQGKFGYSIKK